jgi:hypothetical protein
VHTSNGVHLLPIVLPTLSLRKNGIRRAITVEMIGNELLASIATFDGLEIGAPVVVGELGSTEKSTQQRGHSPLQT